MSAVAFHLQSFPPSPATDNQRCQHESSFLRDATIEEVAWGFSHGFTIVSVRVERIRPGIRLREFRGPDGLLVEFGGRN